jgi:hypothetical protein
VQDDYTSGFVFASDPSEHSDPMSLYGVFSRPAHERDESARVWAAGIGGSPTIVAPLAHKARLLLEDAGLEGESVVAAPTEDGRVWVSLAPSGTGSCGYPTSFGLVINGERRGSRHLVYGLVADEVEGVDLELDGTERAARMGENCFAYGSESSREDMPLRLVLHLEDGSTETIALGG